MNNEPVVPSSDQPAPQPTAPVISEITAPQPTVIRSPESMPVVPTSPTPVSGGSNVPPTESVATEPNQPHSSTGLLKKLALFTLVLIFTALIAGGIFAYENNKVKALESSTAGLNSQIASLKSPQYQLPAGSIKVSDCIPGMGIHNLVKGGDKEYGPFVLTTNKGQVIGIEYMAAPDMYTAIPGTDPPVSVIIKQSPMYGWKYDHAEFSSLPKGHVGLLRNHIDVHMFTVTQNQVAEACK